MDLGLDIVDCVAGFDLEGDRLAREGLDEDLHDEGGLSRYAILRRDGPAESARGSRFEIELWKLKSWHGSKVPKSRSPKFRDFI